MNHPTAACDRHSHQATGQLRLREKGKAESGSQKDKNPSPRPSLALVPGSECSSVLSSTVEKRKLVGLSTQRRNTVHRSISPLPVHLLDSAKCSPICQRNRRNQNLPTLRKLWPSSSTVHSLAAEMIFKPRPLTHKSTKSMVSALSDTPPKGSRSSQERGRERPEHLCPSKLNLRPNDICHAHPE